jgi:hypothetical protein
MTLLARGVTALDDHVLDLAGAAAAERGRSLVFGRVETADRLLEGRKLDHDEAVEFLRPFQDLIASAAGQNLAAVGREDGRKRVYFLYSTGSLILERATQ